MVLLSGSLVNVRDDLHWTHTDGKSAFQTHPDCKHSCVIQCSVWVCEPLLLSAGRHLHYSSCGQYTSLLNIWDGLVFTSSIKSCNHFFMIAYTSNTHRLHNWPVTWSEPCWYQSYQSIVCRLVYVCISAFQIRSSFWLTGE